MNKNNYLKLKEEDINKPIYRVFSYERLVELFKTKRNTLTKPKKWDDPFENFILGSNAQLSSGKIVTISFGDSFYGQCWSMTKESDAMWRIYSPNKNGVKVKTTIKRLAESLSHSVAKKHDICCFIGKVSYHKKSVLIDMIKDRARMREKVLDNTGRGHALTLLMKRWAFRHEKEIRLIYSHSDNNYEEDTYSYQINPQDLIAEIVFDSRMDSKTYRKYKTRLERLGFEKKIIQSGLYNIPNLLIKL